MNQFTEKHKLPKLTQYKLYGLNSPITIKEIKCAA